MMEAANSLMQLAKTSAKLAELSEAKIPYVSLCTDPTTGGTTASFAMLGDRVVDGGAGALTQKSTWFRERCTPAPKIAAQSQESGGRPKGEVWVKTLSVQIDNTWFREIWWVCCWSQLQPVAVGSVHVPVSRLSCMLGWPPAAALEAPRTRRRTDIQILPSVSNNFRKLRKL